MSSPAHGVFRVLAIGDSFTQGVLVKTEESYPEVLEDMFVKTLPEGKRVEVLNLGVGGYDVEYAAYRLQHQGMKYEPDVVVWLLKFDDFFLINEKNSGVRGSMQDELEKVNIPVTKEFTDFNYWSNHIRERYVREFGVASELSYQASKFLRTRTFYRGPIVILYYPDDDPMFIDMLKAFEKRDKGVVLTALPTDMSRFPDSHPDPQGHIAIAQAAWEPVSSLLYAEATPSGGRRYAP